MEIFGWIWVFVFVVLVVFAFDRHLWVKEIEADIKEYLGDRLTVRDASPDEIRCHFNAEISSLKSLIRKHFVL